MEPKFINSYTRTKKYSREIFASIYIKTPFTIICFVICVLSFVINLTNLVLYQNYSLNGLVAAPLFAVFIFFLYVIQERITEKREKELYGGSHEIVATVTDECIEFVHSSGNSSCLQYENIRALKETENLILILSSAKFIYVLDKNSFSIGTAEGFLEFLKSKRSKA